MGSRKTEGYVFAGTHNDRLYINGGWLQSKIRKAGAPSDFIPHGLRHLMESKLVELRIPPHIRDLLMDHAPARGAGARYDHWSYLDEMRSAMETSASHIASLVQAKGATLLR